MSKNGIWETDFNFIREQVNEWDPCSLMIAGTSKDEYDSLTFKILSGLKNDKSDRQLMGTLKNIMRYFLALFSLIFSLNCSSQAQSRQLIEQTAQKVGIQTADIYSRLATSHKFDTRTLIVIPEIAEEGDGYLTFNSHIVLLDDKTGEVKAEFSGQKDWYIDAVSIDKIEIESKLYQLNEEIVAFGLKIDYSNKSKPNPYSGTQLSLYALEGKKLDRVLKDFPIKTFNGETDTTCKGEFEELCKNIQVLDTFSNEFADLKFISKIEFSERNEDCEKVTKETTAESELLKYENGEYKKVL